MTHWLKTTLRMTGYGITALSTLLAAGMIWILIQNQMFWQRICAGGQSNPEFHSADCKDAETLAFMGLGLTAVLLLPLTILILTRLRRR